MRARRLAAVAAASIALAAGCTSDHGALPPPTASPSPIETSEGVAAQALLNADDLPGDFTEQDIDAADRWADVLDETSQLNPVRPDCTEPLATISATLDDVPPDAAGVGFTDDDGREILQFAGVGEAGAARQLVEQIADLNARCDGYTLQVPESGSLALTVAPLDLPGVPESDDVVTTVWERTLISETLRRIEIRVAIAAGEVITLIGFTGDPQLTEGEVADVVTTAAELAEDAGA
ncbi:MAG: hypothetical protein ACRDWI_11760 [Jiangellaceae bacterium]